MVQLTLVSEKLAGKNYNDGQIGIAYLIKLSDFQ